MIKNLICFFTLAVLFISCNRDEVIVAESGQAPVIELDSEDGIYAVKIGRELVIAPTYQYADHALFAWTIEGKLISTDPTLKYTWDESGEVYITLRVDNENGHAEEEVKVEVRDLLPPAINLYVPAKGLKVQKGVENTLTAVIAHSDLAGFKVEWVRAGVVVSTDMTYTFKENQVGVFPITITASNEDGETKKELEIEVVENMPYKVVFPAPSYEQSVSTRYTFVGRPVFLRPLLDYFENPQYRWSVDGKPVEGETGRVYKFTPSFAGEYRITVSVTEMQNGISVESAVTVVCVNGSEASGYRAASGASSAYSNRVYEYTPAPGQFINETNTGGFTGSESTREAAVEYASKRIAKQSYVSLGSFGGYIIVGFDHSIQNKGGYDFAIQGNAFDSSNEPGIVWVMQDVNGNGKPDDEWYELRGSETGGEWTVQEYAVTYYRPAGPRQGVKWTDNLGRSGQVAYLGQFHAQDYYYPLWLEEESHTYYGTGLRQNTTQTPGGDWSNNSFEWGYVDNAGSDNLESSSKTGKTWFKISNAMTPDGQPAGLRYIDFIKVQSAINGSAGGLGELSTEVAGMAVDENLNR